MNGHPHAQTPLRRRKCLRERLSVLGPILNGGAGSPDRPRPARMRALVFVREDAGRPLSLSSAADCRAGRSGSHVADESPDGSVELVSMHLGRHVFESGR